MISSTVPVQSVLLSIAQKIEAALEKHFWRWALLFLALFFADAVLRDIRTPMWIDELLTLTMSQQGGPAEIVKATLEGADGQPPLYAMIVHAIRPVIRNDALAVRLPATLGFCCMIPCMLAFGRRRLPAAYSMASVLLVCNACFAYSFEGRSYGVVLGCAAAALLCWQSAVDGRHRKLALLLLAISVGLMTAMHYYSMFFLVPLFLAEMVRWRTSRKLDWGVLVAMMPVLLVLGLHHSLIAASAPFQRHFWSPASWHSIRLTYSAFYLEIVLWCAIAVGVLALFPNPQQPAILKQKSLTLSEWVATSAFSLMPLFVIALSIYTTHVFVPRYIIWAVPGFAVLTMALLYRAARGWAVVGASFLCVLVAVTAMGEVRYMSHVRQRLPLREGEALRRALESAPNGPEPIAVDDMHSFLELSYYGESRIRERIVCPFSPKLELRYYHDDTDALIFEALSHRTKLHIIGYDSFLASEKHFILATQNEALPWDLIRDGYHVTPIDSSVMPILYDVAAPDKK